MDPDQSIAGRSVLVTGASSGIGRATAERFAAAGADVALLARNADALDRLAADLEAEYGVRIIAVPADVSDESAVTDAVKTTVAEGKRLDSVVVSAGVGHGAGAIDELDTTDYREVMGTNVDGAFFVTRATLPHLRESSGSLVFVGSYAGQYPYPKNPVYGASKAWLASFAKSVEAQAGADGVAVTLVNPGGVRTGFSFGDGMTQAERYEEGTAIEPEEIAATIVFATTAGPGTTLSQVDVYRRNQLSDS